MIKAVPVNFREGTVAGELQVAVRSCLVVKGCGELSMRVEICERDSHKNVWSAINSSATGGIARLGPPSNMPGQVPVEVLM